VGVVVVWAAWLGIRGWMAKGELDDVAALQPRLSRRSPRVTPCAQCRRDRRRTARASRRRVDDRPDLASHRAVPVVGANTAAVRIVAESVRDMAAAAQPVLRQRRSRTTAGRLDLSAVSAAAQPLDEFAAVFSRVDESLTGMSTDDLVEPVATATARIRGGRRGRADGGGGSLCGADHAGDAGSARGSNDPGDGAELG
jgi:hypothetical protein